MATVYVLHSNTADLFYVGFTTISAESRLEKHLHSYYQNKFTSRYDDWILFLDIVCTSAVQAQRIERHIKSMKSSNYIRNLKKYPEMIEKLLMKYKDS